MPSLRERVSRLLLKPELNEIARRESFVETAWRLRPHYFNQRELAELDPETIDWIRRHLRRATDWEPSESERLDAVYDQRLLFREEIITQRLVGLWTDFGFGQNIDIIVQNSEKKSTAEAESSGVTGEDVFREFWTAKRNRPVLKARNLHRLSETLLLDGEIFFVFFIDKNTGQCTLRTVPTEQIKEIIEDADDPNVTLFYKRETTEDNGYGKTIYYPDVYLDRDEGEDIADLGDGRKLLDEYLPSDAVRADEIKDDVDVVMMRVSYRDFGSPARGWPVMYAGAAWVRAYRDLAQDLAILTKNNAMFVRRIMADTGSRGLAALKARFQSSLAGGASSETNPPPVIGSTFISNKTVDIDEMPLNRTASESVNVTNILSAMAALSGGVYPHWIGRGEAFRLATATAMEAPTLRLFSRYQAFWADVWRDMVHIVLDAAEKFGGMNFPYDEREIDVNTDALLDVDLPAFTGALKNVESYLLPETITRLVLQAFNVPDANAIMDEQYPKEENQFDVEKLQAMLNDLIKEAKEMGDNA